MKLNGIVGIAGEYFVAAELSQRGIVATLTLKNTPRVDVIATNLLTGKVANIQVKTMSVENNQGWRLSKKDEESSEIKNFFYVLVNLKGPSELPEYYIFPHKKLAEILRNDYNQWFQSPGRNGRTRNETDMRVLDPYRREDLMKALGKYKNNWNLLKL